jgi:streptogramin lyase
MATEKCVRASRVARALLVLLGVLPWSRASAQEIVEFPIPTPNQARAIAAGPDGNLWFTEFSYDSGGTVATAGIGRITPDGVITEFPIPAASVNGHGITAGPDGNIWFSEFEANRIGRMTTAGVLTEFAIPTAGSLPQGITAGPDGNLWFVEQTGNKIGRITTEGVVTGEFPVPTAGSNPGDITAGPDGNLWFTEQTGNKVARITPAGAIYEIAIPTADSIPHGIVTGPDGNLWFVEGQGGNVARVTPYGTVTEFPNPGRTGESITAGADGNLWFTENSFETAIGRMTTSGVLTEFPIQPFVLANDIVAGPDGRLWLTETQSEGGVYNIARMTTGPCAPNATTMCLAGGRFSVRASWQAPSEKRFSRQASAVPVSGNSGWFWFFDPGNIEVAAKVLDGCEFNGHDWVFAGGLTDVEVTLTVIDTVTGALKAYTNPDGTAFQPIQDTKAFEACPPS